MEPAPQLSLPPLQIEAVVLTESAENRANCCWGKLLGAWSEGCVPPKTRDRPLKIDGRFCLACQEALYVPASNVLVVPRKMIQKSEEYYQGGGPGVWNNSASKAKFYLFNNTAGCKDNISSIVVFERAAERDAALRRSSPASAAIPEADFAEACFNNDGTRSDAETAALAAPHGPCPAPDEWCEDHRGVRCLVLKRANKSSQDLQPKRLVEEAAEATPGALNSGKRPRAPNQTARSNRHRSAQSSKRSSPAVRPSPMYDDDASEDDDRESAGAPRSPRTRTEHSDADLRRALGNQKADKLLKMQLLIGELCELCQEDEDSDEGSTARARLRRMQKMLGAQMPVVAEDLRSIKSQAAAESRSLGGSDAADDELPPCTCSLAAIAADEEREAAPYARSLDLEDPLEDPDDAGTIGATLDECAVDELGPSMERLSIKFLLEADEPLVELQERIEAWLFGTAA